MARVIIGSYLVRLPIGGYMSWMLQWLLGFKRLGHEVYFVEKSGWSRSCLDPVTWTASDDCTQGLSRIQSFFSRFGLQDQWCFVDADGKYHGMSRNQIEAVFRTADVFIDHMRGCEWRTEASGAKVRVMVDGEPAYTQMQMEKNRKGDPGRMDEYDYFFTVGLNVGTHACMVPTAGRQWHPIVDPVVPDLFPVTVAGKTAAFTTVMSWQAHDPIEFEGIEYGQKDTEFPKFMDLPSQTKASLELAIAGRDVPVGDLEKKGWRLRNAPEVTISFDAWCDYIRRSRGEFSVAKNVFVATNSGFFSDRSAVYLACGRPVVMQETGFSDHLPCGRGLFAVRDVQEAASAIHEIEGNYEKHSKWARELACEYLSTDKVLTRLLSEIGL
jgi:hypothetical protein